MPTRVIVGITQTETGTYIVGGDTAHEYPDIDAARAAADIQSAPVCALPYLAYPYEYGEYRYVVAHQFTRRPVSFTTTYDTARKAAARRNRDREARSTL